MTKKKSDEPGIGYGKPPKQNQFKRGKSGNPKGRPKGSKNPGTVVKELNNELIPVTKNGKTKYMTSFRAMMTQIRNDALRGDQKAQREWRICLETYSEADGLPTVPLLLHERDEVVMAGIMDRMRKALTAEILEAINQPTVIESMEDDGDGNNGN